MRETGAAPAKAPADPSSLTANQKRDLVQRVIDSQVFRRAPAMRAFLTYITDHAILGRTDRLKEQTIGTEVLGRKPNYNPADDNIVRVRAHELRGRLEKYFSTEGIGEPFLITIPRGSYAPEFELRKPTPEAPRPEVAEAEAEPAAVVSAKLTPRHWLALAAIVLVAVVTSAAITRYVVRRQAPTAAAALPVAVGDFWGQFFNKPNEELKIVYADSSFALWQRLNGRTLNLGDYLSHKYLDVQDQKLLAVAAQRATSPADISIVAHLATLASEFGGQVNLQFARNVNASFLHQGNLVLIGSSRSNPWVEVYEHSLNFQLAQDPQSGSPLFRNRSPHPGEAAEYAIPAILGPGGADEAQFIQGSEEKEFVSYGVVALLRSCGNRGLTVLTEGLDLQATQAVGDAITDPPFLETLLQSIGHKPGTSVEPFEALVQITSLPGGYDNPKVVAYRLRLLESCVGG